MNLTAALIASELEQTCSRVAVWWHDGASAVTFNCTVRSRAQELMVREATLGNPAARPA